MTIAMFLLVVSLSLWAALHFYPIVIRNRIDRIKTAYADDETAVPNMRKWLKRYKPKYWITSKEEKEFYNSLSDMVQLYRGGSSAYGISWTTRGDVAEFFSFRFGLDDRAVFTTTIPKTEIRAILLDREEDECLILNPKNVEIVTTQPTEHFDEYQKFRAEYDRKEKAMYNEIVKTLQGLKF